MARASCRKRVWKPGSAAWPACNVFTATSRPRTVSVACQTSPIPPAAIRSSRRYRSPSICPGCGIPTRYPGTRFDKDARTTTAGRADVAAVERCLSSHVVPGVRRFAPPEHRLGHPYRVHGGPHVVDPDDAGAVHDAEDDRGEGARQPVV